MYYVRVFGEPAPSGSWGWRFGGHHVSINHTVVDGELGASTPCFLGADPASSPLLGPHLLRPLAGAEDLGRELVRSLDADQLDRGAAQPGRAGRPGHGQPVTGRRRATGRCRSVEIWRAPLGGRLGDGMDTAQAAMERSVGLRPEHVDARQLHA